MLRQFGGESCPCPFFFFRRTCCLVHIVLWVAVSDCCIYVLNDIGNDPFCRSNMNSDTCNLYKSDIFFHMIPSPPTGRPVHSDINSASLGSIPSRCNNYCAKTISTKEQHQMKESKNSSQTFAHSAISFVRACMQKLSRTYTEFSHLPELSLSMALNIVSRLSLFRYNISVNEAPP